MTASHSRTQPSPPPTPPGAAPVGPRPGIAAAVYFGLALLYFFPAFLPDRHIFGTDYLAGSYFFWDFIAGRLAAGEIPAWVPYIYGGMPLFANPGSTFYPIWLVLALLLPTWKVMPALLVLQFGIAGIGTYLLARELGVRPWISFVAGLAYQFTGITMSAVYAGHDGRIIVATLAPLLFFLLHWGVRTGAPGPFVGAAATVGFSLLSFQIQSNYYLLLGGAAWAVFALVHLGYARQPGPAARRVALGLAAVAFGFLLASVNFLPFLDYVPESPRGGGEGRGYEYSVSWSMPPSEIVSLAVPEVPGILENYQGENPFKLHTEYAGALVVLLLVVGFRFARDSRTWWFFLGLTVFFLTIAFGGHTPVYRLYYELLPGTRRFRAPSISFFMVAMALVTMAAITLERLAGAREASRGRTARPDDAARALGWILGGVVAVGLLATVGSAATAGAEPRDAAATAGIFRFTFFAALTAGLLWLWFRDRVASRAMVLLLGTVTLVDLWVIDRRFFETVEPPEYMFAADDVVEFLRAQPGPARVWALPFPAGQTYHQGNYLMHFGIEQAGGEHPNPLQRYYDYVGAGERSYVDWHNFLEQPQFLNAANVRYIVSMVPIETPFLREVHRGTALVYENLAALPRAYLVGETIPVETPEQALERLQSPEFDPARSAVVEGGEALPTSAGGSAQGGPVAGSARVVEHAPGRVVVRVDAARPALLVLADNEYEGWRARVDGREVPLYRTNLTFRGVQVPAGEHEVVFEFAPPDLRTGLWISLAGFLLLAAAGAWIVARGWRTRAAA